MPNPPLDWRKIEAALERLFRNEDYIMDRREDSGDLTADPKAEWTVNLTELAKDLAAELSHE